MTAASSPLARYFENLNTILLNTAFMHTSFPEDSSGWICYLFLEVSKSLSFSNNTIYNNNFKINLNLLINSFIIPT